MSQEVKDEFSKGDYKFIIYEHDHKYLRSRNPAQYVNYQAPQSEIVNKQFYIKNVMDPKNTQKIPSEI